MTLPKESTTNVVWNVAPAAQPAHAPHGVAAALPFLALCAAAVALVAAPELHQRIMAARLPAWMRLLPVGVFGGVLVALAAARIQQVKHGLCPSGRVALELAAGLTALTLLLGPAVREFGMGRAQEAAPDTLSALMVHPDARVRAAAAELAGHRDPKRYAAALHTLEQDGNEDVAQAARTALSGGAP